MVLEQHGAARSAQVSETHTFLRGELERLGQELGALEGAIAAHISRNKDHLPASKKQRLAELSGLQRQMHMRAARIASLDTAPSQGPTTLGTKGADDRLVVETVAFDPMLQGQIELLNSRQRLTQDRIGVVQHAIDRTAQVEMEMNAMQRQFELVQRQHQDALRKATAAATGKKREDGRQAERFEVIEPAQVPEAPIAPRREFIAIGGALGSLILAVGLAGLLEWLSRILRTGADCQRLLSMRPVVVIPPMPTHRELRRARTRRIALSVSVLLVLAVSVWLSPIDVPQRMFPDIDLTEGERIFGTVFLAAELD